MPFDSQPALKGELLELRPLQPEDFDALFAVAADPLIWEQHPARDRHQEEQFRIFFREALESGGALAAIDTKDGRIIGSSRFHGYDKDGSEIEIGWTFLARSHWGGRYNGEMKRLMLRHAFQFVDRVVFLVGPGNLRSQRAVERIGGVRVGSRADGSGRESLVYQITAAEFQQKEEIERPIRIGGMNSAALADAADANFVVHASWAAGRLEGMSVRADEELVLVDSWLPSDTFNVICRARLGPATAMRRIGEAVSHERPFSWWVGPADRPRDLAELLARHGLEPAESELAMAAELASIEPCDLSPQGLQIRRVQTVEHLRDFARLAASGPSDPAVRAFYERAAALLLSPESPQWLYVGHLGQEPVGTAELTVSDGVVGLYGVLTAPQQRRRGFGTALTLRALLDARAAGHRIAVLQASREGARMYSRLGFAPFGVITEFKRPGGAA